MDMCVYLAPQFDRFTCRSGAGLTHYPAKVPISLLLLPWPLQVHTTRGFTPPLSSNYWKTCLFVQIRKNNPRLWWYNPSCSEYSVKLQLTTRGVRFWQPAWIPANLPSLVLPLTCVRPPGTECSVYTNLPAFKQGSTLPTLKKPETVKPISSIYSCLLYNLWTTPSTYSCPIQISLGWIISGSLRDNALLLV